MLHLAFPNQILYRARNIFDGHIQVHAMLVEEIDGIDLQPFERALANLLNMRRPAVESAPFVAITWICFPAKLCRDDDFAAKRREGLADQLFVSTADRRLRPYQRM